MFLQKGMDLHASLKSEQTPDLRLGEALRPIPLNRQRFQRGARQISAAGNKLCGKLIGNFDGYLHTRRIPPGIFSAIDDALYSARPRQTPNQRSPSVQLPAGANPAFSSIRSACPGAYL